ncbi:MAG: hypothetical protein LBQ52_00280 [Helicobacteraceae bacterium]|jgi:hypothetical protein|nr:hypothetical protein [Helicobacteraceae bacterium]
MFLASLVSFLKSKSEIVSTICPSFPKALIVSFIPALITLGCSSTSGNSALSAGNAPYSCSKSDKAVVPTFKPNVTDETLTITQDSVFETNLVPNLIVSKDNVTLRFSAPLSSGLFSPVQHR